MTKYVCHPTSAQMLSAFVHSQRERDPSTPPEHGLDSNDGKRTSGAPRSADGTGVLVGAALGRGVADGAGVGARGLERMAHFFTDCPV
jgi:hypothetical protein